MKILIFKIICLFMVIEAVLRLLPTGEWYCSLDRIAQEKTAKYIFIGTSRVACSINPSVFTQAVSARDDQCITLNMGMGYSTLIEHLFGIRRLARNSPDKLKGVVVFLEAHQGIPNTENWDWQSSWVHSDNPELLATTMCFTDLREFWFKSGTDINSKLMVTASMLSETVRLKGRWRTVLFSVANLASTNASNKSKGPVFLAAEIRTDHQGIQNARKLAQAEVDKQINSQDQMPANYWEKSVLKSLYEQVTSAGGQLILFQMPLSSIKAKLYSTEIGIKNKEIVSKAMSTAHIPLLESTIMTTDDDFPDYWHLRGSRNVEYTQSVAQAYLNLINMEVGK